MVALPLTMESDVDLPKSRVLHLGGILDSTHLTQKDQSCRSGQAQPGSPTPTLVWTTLLQALAGRPTRRPAKRPACRRIPSSFGCSPPLLPSFLSSPLSSNPPGPLTLLPDNPPNLPARRATHVSLTFRSSDSPNLPTAISNRRPQACVRRMQRRRLHNRTSSRVCKRSWAAEHGLRFGRAPLLLATSNQPLTNH